MLRRSRAARPKPVPTKNTLAGSGLVDIGTEAAAKPADSKELWRLVKVTVVNGVVVSRTIQALPPNP